MSNNNLWQAKYGTNCGYIVFNLFLLSLLNNNIDIKQYTLSLAKSSMVYPTGKECLILMAKMEELHKSAICWLVSLPRLNNVSFQHHTVMQACATGT